MAKKILFIGHSYHQKTKSSGFFIDYLRMSSEVTIEWDDAWLDGKVEKDYVAMSKKFDMTIVWQTPETIKHLARYGAYNLVYVPMYDAAHSLGREFWRVLRRVKIICFSVAIFTICKRHRLDSYLIQYFPEKCDRSPIGYKLKKLFFWQRRDWPNWATVSGILPPIQFDAIHLHLSLDPGAKYLVMPTAAENNSHKITTSTWFDKKEDLINIINKYNVYFVPREFEGIGFSFIDAMSHGLVPIGVNSPTLNEYVVDGINGYLVPRESISHFDIGDLNVLGCNVVHYLRKGRAIYERRLHGLGLFLNKKTTPPNYIISNRMQHRLHQQTCLSNIRKRSVLASNCPLVTVVTVVRNDASGLSRTIDSVFSQSYGNYEFIVIDGNSTDRTRSIISRHSTSIDLVVSENDKGPYDAMMKGAGLAKGRYVIFMNAGDEFAGENSLEDALQDVPNNVDIIYGHHFYVLDTGAYKTHMAGNLDKTYSDLCEGNISDQWLHGVPCHQSTLISKKILVEIGFDDKLKIAADHDLLFKACAIGGVTYHTNTYIANYYSGGMSSKNDERCLDEWESIALRHATKKEAVLDFYGKRRKSMDKK